ncbi:class I SAM-dependent methyltransferase [Williamsia muralis]|uniref:Methyltransferase domain-containing protein n=1 Tax=Williamsia marianensis TaxID=85044 RepID=A0ABU4EVD4_WILMA|nr:methyltransferase domain-containing protein [Williamsia muralis]MDV7135215.1 methyltransferase domain-containing protein [Williamsia muralis]
MSTPWARGRYRTVADHLVPLAEDLVAVTGRRTPLVGAVVYDLACGTGSAALLCAREGAQVTGVDLTVELLEEAEVEAARSGLDIRWVCADASATGLPPADVVLSSVGIIFVQPEPQITEVRRLLEPGGTFAYTAWASAPDQPLFAPIADVLGPSPAPQFGDVSPESWADPAVIEQRLADGFIDVVVDERDHLWQFGSVDEAMHLVTSESPVHVNLLSMIDDERGQQVINGFRDVFGDLAHADGSVTFAAPYVVVSATRDRTSWQ